MYGLCTGSVRIVHGKIPCNARFMTQLTATDGTPISRLTFGTMQFGGNADASASRAMYDAARTAGINHFDTAILYNDGASEQLLGPMVKHERDAIYLATKIGFAQGATRDVLHTQFTQSLKQLQLDSVDLLYLHRFDPEVTLEESFTVLAELQSQGKIRHIGVSNYAAWQVVKAQSVAAKLGTKIDVVQPMYNLVKRQSEVEIFPMAMDQGIEIMPYSPLGGGLLTGKYASGGTGRISDQKDYNARYKPQWMHKTAEKLSHFANDLDVSPATLAVAWAAAHPATPHPIISARSVTQLKPSLAAANFPMTPALYAQISALSITPAPATDRLDEV